MKNSMKIAALILFGIIGIYIIFILFLYLGFDEWDKTGTFGDSFAIINTLFSGLALSGVIYTFMLQAKTLELQRQDHELSIRPLIALEVSKDEEKHFIFRATNVGNGTALYVDLGAFMLNDYFFTTDTIVSLKAGETKEFNLSIYDKSMLSFERNWKEILLYAIEEAEKANIAQNAIVINLRVSYYNILNAAHSQKFIYSLVSDRITMDKRND
ncbi:hypothetical protein [Paenibacillus agilis]|uniref:Uncharacterized protein n=1 Tax=Paenibacillus agilis TaxID=3020863 RepID=A0A559J073_9BACL|nr:hypothetical protein [Paenibacillus agilis]TVX93274.1 hypothetical protein FPZ44_09520 [Paenibacillus agilis]